MRSARTDDTVCEDERRAFDALWGVGIAKDVVVMTHDRLERQREVVASLPATVGREGRLLYAS